MEGVKIIATSGLGDDIDYLLFDDNGNLLCPDCHGIKNSESCKCAEEYLTRYWDNEIQREQESKADELRKSAFVYPQLARWTFAVASQSTATEQAKKYIINWDEMFNENTGLLLSAPSRAGKSVILNCIANALIDRLVPAYVTTLADILRVYQHGSHEEKYAIVDKLATPDFLVIDDFNIVGSKDTVLAHVDSIINIRKNANKPLAIASRRKPAELRNTLTSYSCDTYEMLKALCCLQIPFDSTFLLSEVTEQKRKAFEKL